MKKIIKKSKKGALTFLFVFEPPHITPLSNWLAPPQPPATPPASIPATTHLLTIVLARLWMINFLEHDKSLATVPLHAASAIPKQLEQLTARVLRFRPIGRPKKR